jgi:3-oxoadipate enol-lactonase
MPFAEAPDGARIHYRLDGPVGAPALMLSNSLGTDLGLWERQLPVLGGYRLLRWDARGHGRSDAPAGPYTMEQLSRDALALLDAAGIARTAYAGVSMGGAIGQWLAMNAPERIAGLVLANTAAQFGTPEVWNSRIETVLRDGMGAVTPAVLERWFTPAFQARDPAEVDRVKAMLLATPPLGYAGCSAAIRDTDFRADLGRISAPTLVIGGEHDPATPPEKARELAANIPGAALVLLDAAHLSGNERPEAFNAALTDFLGRIRR